MKSKRVIKLTLISIVLVSGFLMFLFPVQSILLNHFNNSLTDEDLVFTGNQNITRYVDIYKHANVTSAFINISGVNSYCFQEYANVSTDCGGNNTGTYYYNSSTTYLWDQQKAIDGNYSSFASIAGINDPVVINYTIPIGAVNTSLWNVKYANTHRNQSLSSCDFGSAGTTLELRAISDPSSIPYNVRYQCKQGGTWTTLFETPQGSPITVGGRVVSYDFYEEAMYWDFGFLPTNPYLEIGTPAFPKEWSFTGAFNTTVKQSISTKLRNILNNSACDGGTLIGNNCSIPFLFHSDTNGTLKINDIRITWQENIMPNLTIISPNESFNTITYIPVNITAADDYALEYCYFNVTRGASLEVANTRINNCVNSTFTVSGDANYVVHVCINDTSGNQNCSSASFSTINYVPPPSATVSGGGGGSSFHPMDLFQERNQTGSLCIKFKPALDKAYDEARKASFGTETLKVLWIAFWDYVLCRSAASIIPIIFVPIVMKLPKYRRSHYESCANVIGFLGRCKYQPHV